MSHPLLLLVSLAVFMQLLAPTLGFDPWREVPVHHGGARDHREIQDARAGMLREQRSQVGPGGHHHQQVARQSYGGYQQQESETSDLLTYLLPALAITGLSLLFPSIVTINSEGRKRRDADIPESVSSPTDELLEHLSNIYYAATESDECIQRIVCELGATAKSSLKKGNKDLMISLLGKAASNKYSKLFSKFQDGANTANCSKLGCKLME